MSNQKIKICFFSSIRSDYGLQIPLLRGFLDDPAFELTLVVGGAHLHKQFGHTVDLIKADGFTIDHEIDFLKVNGDQINFTESMSLLTSEIGKVFDQDRPDILVLYGDRYELLPLATMALIKNIPMVHVSGGEITEGAIDNQVRNALSKIAHLHLVATEEYGENLRQMMEESWRILVCGEPGLASLKEFRPVSKQELYTELNLDTEKETILATFHPETIQNQITMEFLDKLLSKLGESKKMQVLVTGANADDYGIQINDFLEKNQARLGIRFIPNLGFKRYYSILKYVTAMVGNTSSGMTEAQSFHVPVVNVGKRQRGRALNANVINTDVNVEDVLDGLTESLTPEFRQKLKKSPNIFFDDRSIEKIVSFVKENAHHPELLMKRAPLTGRR